MWNIIRNKDSQSLRQITRTTNKDALAANKNTKAETDPATPPNMMSYLDQTENGPTT